MDDDGNIYLFTTRQEDKRHYLLVIALNNRGKIIWKRSLGTSLDGLKAAQILWDGGNLVLLFSDVFFAEGKARGDFYSAVG